MPKLIIKNSYIKGGAKKRSTHASNLVKYVATRDGVEKIPSGKQLLPETEKQKSFVEKLLHEFPDSKNSHEYHDYLEAPNRKNASEFIETTLEQQAHTLLDSERYLDYIANRPRVEIVNQHGLFSSYGSGDLDLQKIAQELAQHKGNIWTPIISLKREDAQRMACDSAESWKAVLNAEVVKIAESFKISPENFRWYAAFHNESHHPHVHFICYSTNEREGFLNKEGIEKMKSALTNQIFKEELLPLYNLKTENRDQVKEIARETMKILIEEMKNGLEFGEKTEELLLHLAEQLKTTKGKKQYGYLPPKVKNLVDEIVNQLGKIPEVEKCYELWWQCQQEIYSIYSEDTKEKPLLSQCKDFKSIKNMVIQAVAEVEFTSQQRELFQNWEENSEEPIESFFDNIEELYSTNETHETEPQRSKVNSFWQNSPKNWWNEDFKQGKNFLYGNQHKNILQNLDKALAIFSEQKHNPLALLELAKMFDKGVSCPINKEKARECEKEAFSLFCLREEEKPWQYTEYRIGKMYASGVGIEKDYAKAVEWLTKAYTSDTEKPHIYSAYALAGLYKKGLGVKVNPEETFEFYKVASRGNFPFADFEVAKSYETGTGTEKDLTEAQKYYEKALQGFIKMEQKSSDDQLQYRLGKMFLDGKGTEVDLDKAVEYFKKSANLGNEYACYQLAKLYLQKESTLYDMKKAVIYFEKSAEQGNQYAQYTLAKLYFFGKEVEQDREKAKILFEESAEQGNEHAKYYLEHFHDFDFKQTPTAIIMGKLLNHLGKIFEDNLPPIPKKGLHKIDRKRFLKLSQKKQAQGLKKDDFQQRTNY